MCWSVPWPEAVEAEGLTRVPSAVCDCAHGGRVVKEASIAGLFRSRGISGSDVACKSDKSNFSEKQREWVVKRDRLVDVVTAKLKPGLWMKTDYITSSVFCFFNVDTVSHIFILPH